MTKSGNVPHEVLEAAGRGWRIHPLRVHSKLPRLKDWQHLATTDIQQIESWAHKYPNCNWGAAAGLDSGFFAVDVDVPEAMMKLEIEFGLVPEGLTNVTSRGYQLIYQWPQNADVRTATNRPCQGIDIRGQGGQIAIPPSVHPSGHVYHYSDDSLPIPPCPAWLLDLILKNSQQGAPTAGTVASKPIGAGSRQPDAAKDKAQEWTNDPCPEWRGPTDDDELIRRALRSQSGAAAFSNKASFADLWNANEEALSHTYPAEGRSYDASRADAALAQHLAFWTGKDCERIHRLMGQSKLVRDKWDREDYLPRTILGAVSRQIDVFQAASTLVNPQSIPAASPVPGAALAGIEMSLLQLGTQDSVAQIFAQRMSGKMLYNHTRDKWLEWDGTRWQIEATKKALNFARDLARSVNYEGRSSLGSAAFCIGVEQLAKADPLLSAKGSEFDRDNYLLNTPAGTLDLSTRELRNHNPEDRITLCTAVAPSADGGASFERFLAEITQGDRELAEFLQVSLGACSSGAVESHWLLFWIGQGRNGKNTLGDLVLDAMGDYARKVPAATLMAKPQEGHPTEIANLQGIRLAVSSEINDGEHWNEARINEVTGDATLSARFMRGDLFTFQRTHKHLIFGNHRPQLRNVSDAVKSRIKIVPFKASFLGREDFDLPKRLRENLGYVLDWLIQGHRKWYEASKQLPSCKAVETESADYFAAQSTPEMWLAECVQILDPDTRPTSHCPKSSDLYRHYANWKKDRGEVPLSQTRWAEKMRKFKKEASNGVRYRGLMLKPQVGDVPFPPLPNLQPSRAN
jgi:P4 family phage/plasmid primase-like protien